MSLLSVVPQSPCHPSLSCWSGRVLCEECLVQSWWTHDAAGLRRCCHGWSGGTSTASLAEDLWLASASAFHPPPHSGHCRRGSVRWMIVHVNWIVCVAVSKNVTIMYVSARAHSERLSWVVGVWDLPGQPHWRLHGGSDVEIFCKHC